MGLGSGSKHKKEAERLESELGARQTELQACKRELQITKSELQTAKRKVEDLEKECDKQLKRGRLRRRFENCEENHFAGGRKVALSSTRILRVCTPAFQ
jgi:Skp family chaperone for outer membrane proteins